MTLSLIAFESATTFLDLGKATKVTQFICVEFKFLTDASSFVPSDLIGSSIDLAMHEFISTLNLLHFCLSRGSPSKAVDNI
jgi:hypothetical protein